jgi:spore maturation protein CgeB
MHYRFQKFTTIYPEFVQPFVSQLPDYERLGYVQLYDKYIQQHYGWSDYYARNFKALGHEAQEVFVNFEHLQKLWAKEHDVRYTRRGWFYEIVLGQVKMFQPTVIFLEDTYVFNRSFRQQLREVCKQPVTLVGWRAAPTEDYADLRDFDLLLSCGPHFVERMREAEINAELLYHAFEPDVLAAVPPIANRDVDFSFVGSLVLDRGFHNDRYNLVEALMDPTPLQVWGQISTALPDSRRAKAVAALSYKATRVLESLGVSDKLNRKMRQASEKIAHGRQPQTIQDSYGERFHDAVFGLNNFEILGRSRITLNKHIDCAENYAGNARLFEATGMGACLLTDWKVNLGDIFEPDVEVVTFKSAEECVEKARYLLDHEEERQAIAAAGQRRILSDHTYAQRALRLNELILRTLSRKAQVVSTNS